KDRGRPVRSGDNPPGLLQRCENLLPLGVFQQSAHILTGGLTGGLLGYQGTYGNAALQITEWNFKNRPGRNNNGALDHVLKLANVTGPIVSDQRFHGFRGNRLDVPVGPPAELLDKMTHE